MTTSEFDQRGKRISGVKIALHILAGIGMMLLGALMVALLFDFVFQTTPLAALLSWAKGLLCSVGTVLATYGLLRLCVKKVLHGTMADVSIGKVQIWFFDVVCALSLFVILCSLITFKSGSIWASFLMHMLWNAMMISKILLIYPGSTGDSTAIFSIALSTGSSIITGGAFGVEASLFSILGFAIVSLVTVCGIKGKSPKKQRLGKPLRLERPRGFVHGPKGEFRAANG